MSDLRIFAVLFGHFRGYIQTQIAVVLRMYGTSRNTG